MSSSCSSVDLGIDPDFEDAFPDALLYDIEQFADYMTNLRNALTPPINGPECESKCIQVHAALSLVSQSVKDLLVRYPIFKTTNVLMPASQVVQAIKEVDFSVPRPDCARALKCIERLEGAVGNTLRHSVSGRVSHSSPSLPRAPHSVTLGRRCKQHPAFSASISSAAQYRSQNVLDSEKNVQLRRNRVQRRHSAYQGRSNRRVEGNQAGHMSTGPQSPPSVPWMESPRCSWGRRWGSTRSTPGRVKRLLRHQRQGHTHHSYNNNNGGPLAEAERLGPASCASPPCMRRDALGRPRGGEVGLGPAGRSSHLRRARMSDPAALGERAFWAQLEATDALSHVMQELLARQPNGLDLAFEQCKSWSKYASQLLQFVRNRVLMEHEHARNVAKLAEQTKSLILQDPNNNPLPLAALYEEIMDNQMGLTHRTEYLISVLNQKFITALENRQKEHDQCRRRLKNEWTKQKKQLVGVTRPLFTLQDQCEDDLRKAIQNLNLKEGGYLKARDHTIRHVQGVPARPVADPIRQRKEIEKRRKNEENAYNRKTEAEKEVWRLERELDERRRAVDELRGLTISELCDLIRHCDLTTIACTSHYIKAFAELWTPLPQEYNGLAHALRESSPGSEYMSFLQSLPGRSISSASLLRGNNSTSEKGDDDFNMSMATSSSESAPSTSRRRNALNAEEHIDYIAETSHRRQKKSMTRIFDQTLNTADHSEAARSHQLQRTRQVTRCAHCEHLVIFDAVKCTVCGIVWHKKCLPVVSVVCGPSAHRLHVEADSQRRMSIFGVPLVGHLQAQQRRVPLILEKCVDELQRRGMGCKGIYRTCGVKSKIEQICVQFEQACEEAKIDLTDVHPMNLASVVKLYLRKLPDPLMTFDLYREWLDFDAGDCPAATVANLRALCARLPGPNHDTLKFLMLHLKRVSWFELENLMTAANLAAVISPSLIWNRACNTGPPSTPASFSSSSASSTNQSNFINDAHQQTKVVELLIQHAFEIFDVDMALDWKQFFATYKEVQEPKLADADTEAKLSKQLKTEFLDEEDDLEEDFEMEDEPDMTNLPPASQDFSLRGSERSVGSNSSQLYNRRFNPSMYNNSDSKLSANKHRSFTTSILVSPLVERKPTALAEKSGSLEEKAGFSQEPNTLRSGDVVVEIKKDQYCVPDYEADPSAKAVGALSGLDKDIPHVDDDDADQYSLRSKRASNASEEQRVRVPNVGVIFTGGDVSYV